MTFDDNESCFGSQNAWFLDVTGTAGRTARAAKIVPVLWPVSHRATLCHALSSARGTWVISSSVVEASSNWPDPKVRGNWKILHFVQDDIVTRFAAEDSWSLCPGRVEPRPYTRVIYSPVDVFTLIRSPVFMNRGVFTFMPVSVTTVLVAPETVSPATAISESTTS